MRRSLPAFDWLVTGGVGPLLVAIRAQHFLPCCNEEQTRLLLRPLPIQIILVEFVS